MKNKTYLQQISTIYLIIAGSLLGLSFISLFFNEWILIPCILICALFGYLSLFLFYKQSKNVALSSGIYTLLRYLIMAVGLAICALLVKFTMAEEENSKRYIMLVVCAIPYFAPTLAILFAPGEKNGK